MDCFGARVSSSGGIGCRKLHRWSTGLVASSFILELFFLYHCAEGSVHLHTDERLAD